MPAFSPRKGRDFSLGNAVKTVSFKSKTVLTFKAPAVIPKVLVVVVQRLLPAVS